MTEKINYDNAADEVHVRYSDSPKRPYPGVVANRIQKNRWDACYSNNGRKFHLGTHDTAEQARAAVLIAQAEYLEQKAAKYRAEAAQVMAR